ncbi:MAG: hypothetical protein WCW40_02820 [Bacteroidota bacterium]
MNRILLLLSISCVLMQGQEIRFIQEDITMQIEGGMFSVEGYYWFYNASPVARDQVMYFPFGNRLEIVADAHANVMNVATGAGIPLTSQMPDGFTFILSVPGNDTAVYRIAYRQHTSGDSVTYVLRSTQQWGRALESAQYKLRTDVRMLMKSFSIAPDKEYTVGAERIYYWKRSNFMPDKDMTFHFRKQ